MAAASIKSKSSTRQRAAKSKTPKKSSAAGNFYNRFKEFHGQQYTGMKVGRSHKWNYDQGEWRETKITPDLWEISYAVTKRRAGKAPEGSGVPVGTGYHWYIVAHQEVIKLNANDYSTALTGLKFKLAHKRADKDKWNASVKAQRKRTITFLQSIITQLEQAPIPIEVEVKGKKFTGEAIPITPTCHDGICEELEVTLNEEPLGILKHSKSGWKMDLEHDPELIEALGEKIQLWYE
jgi:hypothetical protein